MGPRRPDRLRVLMHFFDLGKTASQGMQEHNVFNSFGLGAERFMCGISLPHFWALMINLIRKRPINCCAKYIYDGNYVDSYFISL